MYPQTYSVDELSARCGLASYILRYWQIQFPQLRESDGSPKTRFTVNDEALVMRIKKFLYVDHLSIEETMARIAEEIKFPTCFRRRFLGIIHWKGVGTLLFSLCAG